MREMGTGGEVDSLSTVISMLANISTTGFIIMFSNFENTTLSRYNNPDFISLNNILEGLHDSVSRGVKIDVQITGLSMQYGPGSRVTTNMGYINQNLKILWSRH